VKVRLPDVVSEAAPAVVTRVPDVVGRVNTVLPAMAGAWRVTVPDVSPATIKLAIIFPL
jgi:hypothetical protein